MNTSRIRMIDRETALTMLEGALECSELRFARSLALAWLAAYPGDLRVRFLQARLLDEEGQRAQAVQALEQILRLDPHDHEIYPLIARLCKMSDPARYHNAVTLQYALSNGAAGTPTYPWGEPLRVIIQAMDRGQWGDVGRLIPALMRKATDLHLAAVIHLRWSQVAQDPDAAMQLAQLYRNRWPDSLALNLILAWGQLQTGEEQAGVRLMYQCAANDSAGQVVQRLWGKNHAYRALWPDEMLIPFDLPVPAAVASRLGWNQLEASNAAAQKPPAAQAPVQAQTAAASSPQPPAPQAPAAQPAQASPAVPVAPARPAPAAQQAPAAAQSAPTPTATPSVEEIRLAVGVEKNGNGKRNAADPIRIAEAEFEKLARKMKRPDLAREDGRAPAFVLFSARSGLVKEYGSQTASQIDQELRKISGLIEERTGWDTLVFYPDDEACAKKWDLSPADASDPWKLKLALADLDKALAKKGEMIGCLLIVGGDRVVPLHRLPNPTDDFDREVPSDSPYATRDANYFIPEWPVGRILGEPGPDAGFLIEQLRRMERYHAKMLSQGKIKIGWLRRLAELLNSLRSKRADHSTGYTAAIWRRSSMAVFRPIGAPHTIIASPPETSDSIDAEMLVSAGLGYYNLHGTEDSPNWFGQRDPTEGGEAPDYPVALAPTDLKRNGKAPRVVFSEACYGAQIFGKTENQSMAMKFLGIGVQAVVASTCISYGSVTTPLISADLLGSLFWKHLKIGHTAGEALFQSRIDLAREMDRRQGYLDGEDQKALISFVLLGDPLAVYEGFNLQAKNGRRLKDHAEVKAASEMILPDLPIIPDEVIARAKRLAAEYLPGAGQNLDVHLSRQESELPQPLAKNGRKSKVHTDEGRIIVTVSQEVRYAKSIHHHYLRVTIDDGGKPLKVAVSR